MSTYKNDDYRAYQSALPGFMPGALGHIRRALTISAVAAADVVVKARRLDPVWRGLVEPGRGPALLPDEAYRLQLWEHCLRPYFTGVIDRDWPRGQGVWLHWDLSRVVSAMWHDDYGLIWSTAFVPYTGYPTCAVEWLDGEAVATVTARPPSDTIASITRRAGTLAEAVAKDLRSALDNDGDGLCEAMVRHGLTILGGANRQLPDRVGVFAVDGLTKVACRAYAPLPSQSGSVEYVDVWVVV